MRKNRQQNIGIKEGVSCPSTYDMGVTTRRLDLVKGEDEFNIDIYNKSSNWRNFLCTPPSGLSKGICVA